MIGNRDILKRADKLLGAGLTYVDSLEAARNGAVPVLHVPSKDSDKIVDGQISPAGGEAAYQYIVKAVEVALAGQIAVIVTAPLNKAALHAAGHHFDGHTELLAAPDRREVLLHAARLGQALGGARDHSRQPQGRDPARHHSSACWAPSARATSTSRRSATPARASRWPG